ncbi:MAG: hypothetical protein ACYDCN_05465 [Bacteroidia bacterium]
MKNTIIILFICIPVLFYYAIGYYGEWARDDSRCIIQIINKDCEVDKNGNDRWGHNIAYYEKSREYNNLNRNLLLGALILDATLALYLYDVYDRRKRNEKIY